MLSVQWDAARAVAAGQGWLLSAEQAREAGLTPSEIKHALRAGSAQSIYKGVYLLDPDLGSQLDWPQWFSAALLAHGADAFLVGWSAVRAVRGAGLPVSDPSIDLGLRRLTSRHARQPTGEAPGSDSGAAPPIVVRQWPVPVEEIALVNGFRMRRVEQSVIDAALMLDRPYALCLFDWALRSGVHSAPSLADSVAAIRRRPGAVHVREMAARADGRAASPLESRVRLACIDGGVPPDELQYPVLDSAGIVLGYGDLAWLRRRRPLIGEADGRDVHTLPNALFHDRRRANNFIGQSCDIVRFTWADAIRPVYIQQIVRTALAA